MRIQPLATRFKIIGAADISYCRHTGCLIAVILSFKWPSLDLIESVHHVCKVSFPYVPGLLSFREVPPLIEAYRKIGKKPDVLLCDGQGIAHPRKLGFAAHLGLCLGIPTVGCAKSRLCGDHERLTLRKGRSVPLLLDGEQVGLVFCSRDGVKPIYISPGHLSDIASSKEARIALPSTLPDTRTAQARPHRCKPYQARAGYRIEKDRVTLLLPVVRQFPLTAGFGQSKGNKDCFPAGIAKIKAPTRRHPAKADRHGQSPLFRKPGV